MESLLDPLSLPFFREALAELALLAVAGGVLGGWIVLRRLAFFTHAVGAAAFPALVLAGPIGTSPQVAGMVAAAGYAAGVERASRGGRDLELATGLVLVASLGAGVILASYVVGPSAAADQLLFGTLLGVAPIDLALSAGAAAIAVAATVLLGRGWLAASFDPGGARSLALPARALDALLLGLVALAAVTAIPAVGALLVASLFVVPAATARLLDSTLRSLFAWSVGFAALQGVAGLYVAYWVDIAPGPAVAALGAALYAVVRLASAATGR